MGDSFSLDRDPRVRPAPGDVLQKSRTCADGTRREVRVVTAVRVIQSARPYGDGMAGLVYYHNRARNHRKYADVRSLAEWRRWAAGADVVEAA